MGFAEFIIGPAEGRSRWLNPSYIRAAFARPITFGADGTAAEFTLDCRQILQTQNFAI
jgi:hypothetical protein